MGDMVYEDFPRLLKRPGDASLQGSNNTAIVLGRDRDEKSSGAIRLVAGRKSETPDALSDDATVYVSMKTNPDTVAGTDFGQPSSDRSAIVCRADCIRIASKRDVKISSSSAYISINSDGSIVLDGDISLGEGAVEHLLKGETFIAWSSAHTHPIVPGGSTGPPTQPPPQSALSMRPVKVR